jgi:hypothetical protein
MTMRASHWRWGIAAAILALSGCTRVSLPPVPATSPFAGGTLSGYDASLRHYLVARDSLGIWGVLDAGPKDALLREMQKGLVLRRLGSLRQSNIALQEADRLARERYTKSISQNLAAFLVSDNALDFYPSAIEWSMLHFYGMLNYLELGDSEDALVEARRANQLVRRYANDNPGRSYSVDAAVQYLAGLLQWSAGDLNNAVVSLRQSLAAYERYDEMFGIPPPTPVAEDLMRVSGELGLHDVVAQVRQSYPASPYATGKAPSGENSGELVLLVENGFVAHRASQKLYIPILAREKDSILAGDAESALTAAVMVLARTVIVMNELSRSGHEFPRYEDGVLIATVGSAVGLELISLAWPVYEHEAVAARDVRVTVGRAPSLTAYLLQDLSAVAVRDFEERKTTVLLRMVARGLLKEAGVTVAEASGGRLGGDIGGFLARVAARAISSATERADTRTWSTLPNEISVVRSALPPGQQSVEVSYIGLGGVRQSKTIVVDILPGKVTIASVSLVGTSGGDTDMRYSVPDRPGRRGGD